MRILILGGDGMLGHQLLTTLCQRHEVRVSLRQERRAYSSNLFTPENSYTGIDVRIQEDVLQLLNDFKPEAVINCIGIVKQRKLAKETIPSLEINALLPHRLASFCKLIGARLIHMSTDCVFSGKKGNYTEDDWSDAEDLYGKSKYLGELHEDHCLTLRSSIIGLELSRKTSLLEWFLAQHTEILGYRQAVYSGVTTLEMSRIIETMLISQPKLSGVWHVAAKTAIDKYSLLAQLAELLQKKIKITVDDEFKCDRSLNADRFNTMTGYQPKSWQFMLNELADQIKTREKQVCY